MKRSIKVFLAVLLVVFVVLMPVACDLYPDEDDDPAPPPTYGTIVFDNNTSYYLYCYINTYYQGGCSIGGTFTITKVPVGWTALDAWNYDKSKHWGTVTIYLDPGETYTVTLMN